MTDQYFPIRTDTACQLKWAWSSIRMYTGKVSSCHRVKQTPIAAADFNNFHNTPLNLQHRAMMLKGQWPGDGCDICENTERQGGSSDRLLHLGIPNLTPKELYGNPTAIHVEPTVVEVYFDNVCNQSCLYCWDGLSSRIQQENIKFGRFDQEGVVIDNRAIKSPEHTRLIESFWTWLRANGSGLKRLHVLGGEPLYQKQFDQLLDLISDHPMPDLEFNIVTNLKTPHRRLKRIIHSVNDLIQKGHIKRLDITASIDCFGEAQEYVRYGMDLNLWKKNFSYLASIPWLILNINQTITGLTIKTMPEMIEFINLVRQIKDIGHFFSVVDDTHEFLQPGIFGGNFFDQDFENILRTMPDSTHQEKESRKTMQGVQLHINSCDRDKILIHQLGIFLNEIDRRRSLDWRSAFPWLQKEISSVV